MNTGSYCLYALFHQEQTQENLQKFEHQAGLTDAGYSPHKGLSTEETRFHRLGEGTLPVSIKKREEETLCKKFVPVL